MSVTENQFLLYPEMLDNGLVKWPYLSVSPTSSTLYHKILRSTGSEYKGQKRDNIKLPDNNKHDGFLSRKAYKRIRRSVDWFLYSVDPEILRTGKGREKVTFITLTLPSSQLKSIENNQPVFYHSDQVIKSQCLNQFFIEGKKRWGLNRKIWKAEKQKNGTIHFHILADCYINHKELRIVWNRIINKLGYVDRYSKQFENVTFNEYLKIRKNDKRKNETSVLFEKRIKDIYKKQTNEKWSNPNTSDIHSLYKSKNGKKILNIGAYIAKYTSKTALSEERLEQIRLAKNQGIENLTIEEKLLQVSGRIWFCSSEISKYKNVQIELDGEKISYQVDDMFNLFRNKIWENETIKSVRVNIEELRRKGFNLILDFFDDFVSEIRKAFVWVPAPLLPCSV
jgi:hypothetical protein